MAEVEEILKELQHEQQLIRSKGQKKLQKLLEGGGEALDGLREGVLDLMASESPHACLGGFLSAALTLPHLQDDADFIKRVEKACVENLENPESRVRYAVGDCLKVLAEQRGAALYASVGTSIRESIVRNFERDEEESDEVTTDDPLESLLETSYRVIKPGSGEMRHGTEGWKSLETSYRALLRIIEGTGPAFHSYTTPELWSLVFRGILHTNRFVREIAYFTISALVSSNHEEDAQGIDDEIVVVLAKGLGDDWSQVRYAASVATRAFMFQQQTRTTECLDWLFPQILPQMCLNRYYVADGVRLYSQETWKNLVGDRGRELVAQFVASFVGYYTKQCGANNHAVREAACSCIAELMTKISKTSVEAHVPRLLQALVNCFKDASWPVRDAACCACGKCVRSFPEQSRPVLEELYTLWLAHLADNISSVREDSATALAETIHAYGDEGLGRILPEIRSSVMEAKNQKPDSVQFPGLQNVTQFGVAGQKADEDSAHTDQTMFSCGSLAPKLGRGGGCMDHGFKRPTEPWEVSDGAVCFVKELSSVRPDSCMEFLPALAELASIHDFAHAHTLHRTVWKAIPVIARNVGKRAFKQHLNDFLSPLFRSLQSGYQLEEAAATEALLFFGQFLGEGIFRGRLNEQQNQLFSAMKTTTAAM